MRTPDTVNDCGSGGGGSGNTSLITSNLTNDDVVTVTIGMAVYGDMPNGFKRANATALSTSGVIGLVADTSIASAAKGNIGRSGPLDATTAEWDAVTGDVGGLVPGDFYYADPTTPGMITKTVPSTSGQVVTQVGEALTTTQMMVLPGLPVVLS